MALAAVFQIGSLGDSVVSVPVIRSLRDRIPGCDEYLLVSRFDTKMKVLPSHIFDMTWKSKHRIDYQGPNRGLREMLSIGAMLGKLRYYRPKHCVYLMPSDRRAEQVARDRLFFRAGGVTDFVGFRALTPDELGHPQRAGIQNMEAYLRFLRVWEQAAPAEYPKYAATPALRPSSPAMQTVAQWLQRNRRYPERRWVAFCPYSNYESRNVPQSTVAAVLAGLEARGGLEVIILGGPKDLQQADKAIALAGAGLNGCGAFSVEESAAALAQCSLALCTESGPMHLAGALGVPLVITFSRINKLLSKWFPLGADYTVLFRDVPCAGCRLTQCTVPGHPCMNDITAEQIISSVLNKLNGLPILPGSLNGTGVVNW